jgi:plasmid stabilization system protein ParE
MSFIVQLSPTAEADLERLFDFLLERAETTKDLDHAQAAIDTIRAITQQQLAVTPYSFRKAAQSPVQRELIVPFGLNRPGPIHPGQFSTDIYPPKWSIFS